MARYRIGYDMTILWAVNDRDGKALPLKDKEVHLYYTCERGRFEADIEIQDTNVIVWNFLGSAQRVLGGYTLTLEVLQSNGKRVIRRDICDVFTLVGKWCEENHNKEEGEINKGGEINLVSELEIYRISPIIPIIGENGNWWIDGQDTGDPSSGKTAYEYALTKGYKGTEEEFAALMAEVPNLSTRVENVETEIRTLEEGVIQDLVFSKQETLVSGQNIKTINGQSVLGSGNIDIEVEDNVYVTSFTVRDLNDLLNNPGRDIQADLQGLYEAIHERKIILVPNGEFSGYGIAVGYLEDLYYLTVYLENGRCIDLEMRGGYDTIYSDEVSERYVVDTKSLKTINGESILGRGDITISGGTDVVVDDALSETSENPVQNKVITARLAELASEVFTNTNMNLNQGGQISVLFDSKAEKEYESAIADKTLTTPNAVGGIAKGTKVSDLEGKTIAEMFDDLLFPTVNPTFTAPSASIAFKNYSSTQEVGATGPTSANFTTGYSAGEIKLNGVKQANRGGTHNTSLSFIYVNGSASNKTLPSKVTLGKTTFNYRAAYNQGPQPKNNKGGNYDSPLSAGTVDSSAITLNGTYPWYASTAAATSTNPVVKQSLVAWNATAGNMSTGQFTVQPSGTLPQVFKLPRKLHTLQLKNALNGQMETVSDVSKDYTESTETINIGGTNVTYYVYTYSGSTRGSVTLLAKF